MNGWLVTASWNDGKSPDEYRVFIENVDDVTPDILARQFYTQLLQDDDLYSANLCEIKDSTEATYLNIVE